MEQKKIISIKVPDNILPRWDNYSFQIKFLLKKGRAILRWRMDNNKGFFLGITDMVERGLLVGTFSGNTYTQAAGDPQWPNPIQTTLNKNEWYLLECLSHVNDDDPSKTFVRIVLDKQIV